METGGVIFGDTEEAVGIDGATVAVAGFKGLDDALEKSDSRAVT